SPRLPGALDGGSGTIPLSLPRRRLLQRWKRRCRSAAASAFSLRRAHQKWRSENQFGRRPNFHHLMKRLFTATWLWLDDRVGISVLLKPMKHIAPQDAKWWYVFGTATMIAFIVQVVSGVALAFSFIPSSSQAYETLV